MNIIPELLDFATAVKLVADVNDDPTPEERQALQLTSATLQEAIRNGLDHVPATAYKTTVKKPANPYRSRVGEPQPMIEAEETRYKPIRIKTADLITWCEKRKIYPSKLFPASPSIDKPLHELERVTLLKIIRALLDLHNNKTNLLLQSKKNNSEQDVIEAKETKKGDGWHGAANALLRVFLKYEVSVPCEVDALGDHLQKAFSKKKF